MSSNNGNGKAKGSPSPNGRDGKGRFALGNAGGPGNPLGKKHERYRSMFLDAVTDEEFKAVRDALLTEAKKGAPWAVKEYLERVIGKVKDTVEIEGGIDADEVRAGVIAFLQDKGSRN